MAATPVLEYRWDSLVSQSKQKMASSRLSERLSPMNTTKSNWAGQPCGLCIHVHGCMLLPIPHAHIHIPCVYKHKVGLVQARLPEHPSEAARSKSAGRVSGASTHRPCRSHPFTQRMPEKAVGLFSHPEILALGRCTHSLEPLPLESLKRENGSTSWKKET